MPVDREAVTRVEWAARPLEPHTAAPRESRNTRT